MSVISAPAFLALAACVMAWPAAAQAPDEGPCLVPPAQLTSLIDWIGEKTGYDTAASRANPPQIAFCVPGDTILYESDDIIVESNLLAAYDAQRRVIHLVRPWDSTDPVDISRLVHELVHDLQVQNGPWDCPQQMEWQAYELQADWLAERGIDAGFNWFGIHLASRCPGQIHP